MRLPPARGPFSAAVKIALISDPADEEFLRVSVPDEVGDLFRDEDLQLGLWMLYEQSYRTFEGARDHEWDPAAVAVRRRLERAFEEQLRAATGAATSAALAAADDVASQIEAAIRESGGPDLARFLHREADREQMLEFLAQRSLFHLKESDPHAFVVGRVGGAAKVALAELLYD